MRNKDKWMPSKFVYRKGKLVAARIPEEVRVGSRLVADLIAKFYDVYIKEYAKGKLIDLGCGKVPLFEAYKNYVENNICVDWRNTLHKNEYLDFELDLTKALPFREGEFDTIILSDVLEHIPQPEHLWKEMSRITVKGGHVLMNVLFYYWIHEAPHDYYRYTEYGLRCLAELAGFKILLLKPLGGAPEVLADIFGKLLEQVPLLGKSLSIGIQYAAYAFIKTGFGKKISEETNRYFPLGYFLIAEKM